jgi:hypothetical protein
MRLQPKNMKNVKKVARLSELRHNKGKMARFRGEGMAKQKPWEILLDVVGRFPQGASLEQILVALDPTVPRRTVQRWLALLVEKHRLIAVGQARARRYKLSRFSAQEEPQSAPLIPLSEAAVEIQFKITRPLQARHPVTYHREF